MCKKQTNGFALIEILVAIVIIALLSTVVGVVFSGPKSKVSEFKRLAAIEDIREALNLYYDDYGFYPDKVTAGKAIINPETGKIYLAKVPDISAAQSSGCTFVNFNYNSTQGGEFYVINYCLDTGDGEEDVVANPDDDACAPDCNNKECDGDNGCGDTCVNYCIISACGSNKITHKGIDYGIVIQGENCWLDRNLGASRVALSINDELSYGDYYQWGRLTDGHEKNNTLVVGEQASLINPGHSKFIVPVTAGCIGYSCKDWLKEEDNNLWQGADGPNNPCPTGWRIPTLLEWKNSSTGLSDVYDFYESTLKVSGAGWRVSSTGDLVSGFANTRFWTSTISDSPYEATSVYMSTLNIDFTENNYRVAGFPVRCIKD